MAAKKKLQDLKSKVEELGHVVSTGFERLVEHELNGLKKHYKELQKSLKSARKAGSIKGAAQTQMDMLQDTIDRILDNLKETADIINATRDELVKITGKGHTSAQAAVKQAAPAAQKAASSASSTTDTYCSASR